MHYPTFKLQLLLPLLCHSSITLAHKTLLTKKSPEPPNTISNEILKYPDSSIQVIQLNSPGGRTLDLHDWVNTFFEPIDFLAGYPNNETLHWNLTLNCDLYSGRWYRFLWRPTNPSSGYKKSDWLVANYELLEAILNKRIPLQEMGARILRGEEEVAQYAVADLLNPDRKPGEPGAGSVTVTTDELDTNLPRRPFGLTAAEVRNKTHRSSADPSNSSDSEWWSWTMDYGPNSMSYEAGTLQIAGMAARTSLLPAGFTLRGNGSEGSFTNEFQAFDLKPTTMTLVNMHTPDIDGDPGIRLDDERVQWALYGFWMIWAGEGKGKEVNMTYFRGSSRADAGGEPYVKIVLRNDTVVVAGEETGFVKVN